MTNTSEQIELGVEGYELRSDNGRDFYIWRNGHFVHNKPLTKAFAAAIAGGVQQGGLREALKELLLASQDAAALPVRGGEQERLEKAQREGWGLLVLTPPNVSEAPKPGALDGSEAHLWRSALHTILYVTRTCVQAPRNGDAKYILGIIEEQIAAIQALTAQPKPEETPPANEEKK